MAQAGAETCPPRHCRPRKAWGRPRASLNRSLTGVESTTSGLTCRSAPFGRASAASDGTAAMAEHEKRGRVACGEQGSGSSGACSGWGAYPGVAPLQWARMTRCVHRRRRGRRLTPDAQLHAVDPKAPPVVVKVAGRGSFTVKGIRVLDITMLLSITGEWRHAEHCTTAQLQGSAAFRAH